VKRELRALLPHGPTRLHTLVLAGLGGSAFLLKSLPEPNPGFGAEAVDGLVAAAGAVYFYYFPIAALAFLVTVAERAIAVKKRKAPAYELHWRLLLLGGAALGAWVWAVLTADPRVAALLSE
jgi:hypothetical protein